MGRTSHPRRRLGTETTLDIDGWLRGSGLGQYAELFRANDFDAALLLRLTAEDPKDVGVTSLGHRKKLLEAIAASVPSPPLTFCDWFTEGFDTLDFQEAGALIDAFRASA